MFGTRTLDRSMEGADESTELLWHQKSFVKSPRIKFLASSHIINLRETFLAKLCFIFQP